MILQQYTHVIIDEVHERDIDADFILILLKTMINCCPDLKLILMSATINAELFANFFSIRQIKEINIRREDVFKLEPIKHDHIEEGNQK